MRAFGFLSGDDNGEDLFGAGCFEDFGTFEKRRAGGGNVVNQQHGLALDALRIADGKSVADVVLARLVISKAHLGHGVALAD